MKLAIKIPNTQDLLITIGQEVDFTTPLFKKKSGVANIIPLSQILKFAPDKIFLNLKKFVGDKIKKGDLLSENKSFFATKQYISEFDGIIKEINHQTGSIVLETESDAADVMNCFFKGEIANIADGFIELKVKNLKEYSIVTATDYFGGEALYVADLSTQTVTENDIEDRILCTETIKPYDQVKYETLGIKSFVTLNDLQNSSSLPRARIKETDDLQEIFKHQFPYCIVGPDHTTMFFYQ